MTKKTRRNHTPAFKAKVALAALKGDRTMAQICQDYSVHASQVLQWKKQLQADAADVFEKGSARKPESSGPDAKELHAKIGQLTMERDFLAEKLAPWVDLSGKR